MEQAALPPGAGSGSLAAGGFPPVGGYAGAGRPSRGSGSGPIQEIRPSTDDDSLIQQGRCEFPSRSFGCKTEEFGSGFVEPSTCQECPVQQRQQPSTVSLAESNPGCDGCNRHRTLQQVAEGGSPELEVLVQRITEEIMSRLGSS